MDPAYMLTSVGGIDSIMQKARLKNYVRLMHLSSDERMARVIIDEHAFSKCLDFTYGTYLHDMRQIRSYYRRDAVTI
jgi:hypothetical protein